MPPSEFIMGLHDRYSDPATSTTFLVMERWPQSLADICRAKIKIPEADLKRIFADVVLGIKNLHRSGVMAVDFHEGNVLIKNNRAKLIDFGGEEWSAIYSFGDYQGVYALLKELLIICDPLRSPAFFDFAAIYKEELNTEEAKRTQWIESVVQPNLDIPFSSAGFPDILFELPWLKDMAPI